MRLWLFAVSLLAAGCGDPVRDDAIAALGGEAPGVKPGPLHRPGQPCVLCHGGSGPGESVFSIAGTVYENPADKIALPNALVKLIDSQGKTYDAATNCAGNFFVMETDYQPAFPVWVKLVFGQAGAGPLEVKMGSAIYREGSCGKCHTDPVGRESVGHVYFAPVGVPFPPPAGCGP
jgi:hypothetical protein